MENNRCSHLCLPNKHSYTCACPTGLRKLDTFTCQEGKFVFCLPTKMTVVVLFNLRRLQTAVREHSPCSPGAHIFVTVSVNFQSEVVKLVWWPCIWITLSQLKMTQNVTWLVRAFLHVGSPVMLSCTLLHYIVLHFVTLHLNTVLTSLIHYILVKCIALCYNVLFKYIAFQ